MRYRVRHPEIAAGVALLAVVGMISMSGMSPANAYKPYELKKESSIAAERQYAELVSDGVVEETRILREKQAFIQMELDRQAAAAAAVEAERQRKAAAEEASRAAARAAVAKKPAATTKSAQTSFTSSAAWAASPKAIAVAKCESGGNPTVVSRTGKYQGKWQMDDSFWRSYGGLEFASDPQYASEAQQDEVAYRGWLARGWQPWSCA